MAIGLRARIILIVAIPAVVAGGVHGLVRMRQERQALFDQDLSNMALTARAIQVAVENTMRNRPQDLTRLLSEMVEQQDLIDRIRLFDAELRPAIVSNPLVASDPAPTDALRRAMQSGAPQTFYRTHDGQSYLYYVVPLQPTPGRIAGAMEIVHLAADVDRRIRAAVIDVWLRLSVLMIVIVSVTALALQRQVLRPVARLMEGIRTLGAGGSEPRVPVDRRDELGRVAEALNEMAAPLEAAPARLLAETERAVELEQHLRQAQT